MRAGSGRLGDEEGGDPCSLSAGKRPLRAAVREERLREAVGCMPAFAQSNGNMGTAEFVEGVPSYATL